MFDFVNSIISHTIKNTKIADHTYHIHIKINLYGNQAALMPLLGFSAKFNFKNQSKSRSGKTKTRQGSMAPYKSKEGSELLP